MPHLSLEVSRLPAALLLVLVALAGCEGGDARAPASRPEGAAGDGGVTPAPFRFEPAAGAALQAPTRLAVAEDGTIFASDPRTDHVFGWRDGRRVLSIGGLRRPLGIAVRGDHLFVGEAGAHAVQRFDWKNERHLGALEGEVTLPTAIAIAPDGELLVSDFGADLVRRWDASLRPLPPIGGRGAGDGQLRLPAAIAVDGETIAVADQGNHRVQLFRRDGTFLRVIGEALPMEASNRAALLGRFTRLQGLALVDGALFALDATHGHLQVAPPGGGFTTLLPVPGVALPLDLVATPAGDLLVSDPDRQRWVTLPAEVTP